MSEIAIRVDGLSKLYRIGAIQNRHDTLRDHLAESFKSLLRRNGRRLALSALPSGPSDNTIWALKDISFAVNRGEVVGIIGRNGAGKSTLLKILSRITEPTTGFAEIHGRVGSLLEVGTGFHAELTGRENIYLNGAILGMKKAEIERKFDEIVAFAEVEKFIDTPVKHYSSGMYLRLAFAVAAHLEPEILIVDEVLAVGDLSFQKKCLGKMGDVARRGRTVLFVSHNMTAIKSLCDRAILLDAGRVVGDGNVDEVVDTYLLPETDMVKTGVIPANAERVSTGDARLRFVQLANISDKPVAQLYYGQSFRVTLVFDVLRDIRDIFIEVNLGTPDGVDIVFATTLAAGRSPMDLMTGRYEVHADFDIVLLPGRYSIGVGIHHSGGKTVDFVRRVLDFMVLKVAQNGNDHFRWDTVRGYVGGLARWHIRQTAPDIMEKTDSTWQ
jgi:lipopolysaccharide transport system ATP-binding protein